MTDYELQWEEPPEEAFAPAKAVGTWWSRLSPLLERPGVWARVATGYEKPTGAQHTLSRLRGRKVKYPPGRFEFVRTQDSVYARYLGPDDE